MRSKLQCYIIGNIRRHLKDKIDAKFMHMTMEEIVRWLHRVGRHTYYPLSFQGAVNNNFMFVGYMTNARNIS